MEMSLPVICCQFCVEMTHFVGNFFSIAEEKKELSIKNYFDVNERCIHCQVYLKLILQRNYNWYLLYLPISTKQLSNFLLSKPKKIFFFRNSEFTDILISYPEKEFLLIPIVFLQSLKLTEFRISIEQNKKA